MGEILQLPVEDFLVHPDGLPLFAPAKGQVTLGLGCPYCDTILSLAVEGILPGSKHKNLRVLGWVCQSVLKIYSHKISRISNHLITYVFLEQPRLSRFC